MNVTDQIENEQLLAQQAAIQPEELTPEQRLQKDILKDEEDSLNNFDVAKVYLGQLITMWKREEQRTEANRLTRDIDINVDALRESGEIEDDETLIPVRVIDSNIQRELPPYINFLKNSRRIAIFKDIIDDTFDTERLEAQFTAGMTYKGWIKPYYKMIDGAETHGWACAEVVYDSSKPLHAGIEYIAHEDLIFFLDSKDIQASQTILRRFKVTPLQLKTWVAKFGFNLQQVMFIIEKQKNSQEKDKTVTVYKRFCKKDGIVYVSWFSQEGATTDWLKKPEQLFCGISEQVPEKTMVPTPTPVLNPLTGETMIVQQMVEQTQLVWKPKAITSYPIFLLPYRETEKPLIFDHVGRVFLDKDKQEAQCSITTSYVNALSRAQKIYASPGENTNDDGKPAKQLPIKFSNGTIFDKKMEFWNMPYPDSQILRALEYFDTANAAEIGQPAFSVMNRQDSRKTAKEIDAAQQESALLDSVDLTLFSEFIRDIYSFVWLIVQSQALQEQIKFIQIRQTQTSNTGSIVDTLGTLQEEAKDVNDIDTIARTFDVRAAGDVDVIQKQEQVAQMMQDWPVIQTTPLAGRFLADLLKLKYPQDGAIYSEILLGGDPKVAIIKALGEVIKGIVAMPEVAQHITPQLAQQLQLLEQEATQVIGGDSASQSQQPQQATQQQG